MNISIVSTLDNVGGAAIAAYRLFKGLKELKQEPVMLVKEKKSNDPGIYKIRTKAPEYKIEQMLFQQIHKEEIFQNRSERSNTWFSLLYPGYDLSKTQVIANSEIINLHWIAGFQSVETIESLLKMKRPVVWTLHDENPYTGGCHYTAGCTKYQKDCKNCLQLNEDSFQLPFYSLKNKINLWNQNLTIVTPSKWLAQGAKKSRVFKDLRVEVIPNSLETDIFKPKAKNLAKKELGLDPQLITLLFGAYTGFEKRKGFVKLLDAMKYCLQDKEFKTLVKKAGIKILTFGPPQEDLEKLDIEIELIGYINDKERLSSIYSAAEIFILPSLEDNLPNTMLEAMACGTPVIGFEVGGLPDMVENDVTGYLAPCFDSEKLGRLILTLVFDKNKRNQMSGNCRQLIEKKFKLQDQAGNYLELFNDLLKNQKSRRRRNESQKVIAKDESDEIILDEWDSKIQEGYFEIYRKSTLDILTKWDTRIKNLQKQVEQQGAQIKNINAQLKQSVGHIKQKDAQIDQKDGKINKLHEQIGQKDEQIKHLRTRVNQMQVQIDQRDGKILKVYGSYTYHIGSLITFPFKKIRRMYRKLKSYLKR